MVNIKIVLFVFLLVKNLLKICSAPLASLNRLNISFLNPQGSLLEYSRDVAVIRNITFSDPTTIGGVLLVMT